MVKETFLTELARLIRDSVQLPVFNYLFFDSRNGSTLQIVNKISKIEV